MYFCLLLILLLEKIPWPFIQINLNPLYLRMLYAKFCWNCLTVSWGGDENVIWAFSSGELKMLSASHQIFFNFPVNGLAVINGFEFYWIQFISSQFIIVSLEYILSNFFYQINLLGLEKKSLYHNLKNTPIPVKSNYCYDFTIQKKMSLQWENKYWLKCL